MYLVRCVDLTSDINDYEFIYRITPMDKGFMIEHTVHASLSFYMCNSDSIYSIKHGGSLTGVRVTSLEISNTDEPDLLFTGNLQVKLYRCSKISRTMFVERDKMLDVLARIIKNIPLVCELDYLRRNCNNSE